MLNKKAPSTEMPKITLCKIMKTIVRLKRERGVGWGKGGWGVSMECSLVSPRLPTQMHHKLLLYWIFGEGHFIFEGTFRQIELKISQISL